jgi:hypothetical protein
MAVRSSTLIVIAGAVLALALAPTLATARDEPKRIRVHVKIMDIDGSGVDGGLRAAASVCEKHRRVDLYYTASYAGDDWTKVASTAADRGGFWEFDQSLAPGGYQARVAQKSTRDYNCKRSFSDVEELF